MLRDLVRSVRTQATVAAVLAASACGVDGAKTESNTELGDAAELGQEKRVSPTDEETLGKLTVFAPPGWTLPTNPDSDAKLSFRPDGGNSVALQFGTAWRSVATKGCVQVTSKFPSITTLCGVEVRPNTARDVYLGSLKALFDRSATGNLWVNFGPKALLQIKNVGGGSAPDAPLTLIYDEANSNTQNYRDTWSGQAVNRAALAAPGKYVFGFGVPVIPTVEEVLAEGENATLNLGTTDYRATLVLKAPVRELPDAPITTCQTKERTFLVQRNVDNANGQLGEPHPYDQRSYPQNAASYPDGYNSGYDSQNFAPFRPLAVAADTSLKLFPFTPAEAPKRYELVLNNVVMPLELRAGLTTTVQIERIDMDDVTVRREDGSTYQARGTWKLFRQGPNSTWIPLTKRKPAYSDCSGSTNGATEQLVFPTNSGVDVFPGTYRVVLDYTTGEGAKQKDFTVTVP